MTHTYYYRSYSKAKRISMPVVGWKKKKKNTNRKPKQRHLEIVGFARLRPEIQNMDRAYHASLRQITPYPEVVTEGEGIKVKSARVNDSTPGDSTIKAGEQAMPCDDKPMVLALVRPRQDDRDGLTGYGNSHISKP